LSQRLKDLRSSTLFSFPVPECILSETPAGLAACSLFLLSSRSIAASRFPLHLEMGRFWTGTLLDPVELFQLPLPSAKALFPVGVPGEPSLPFL